MLARIMMKYEEILNFSIKISCFESLVSFAGIDSFPKAISYLFKDFLILIY